MRIPQRRHRQHGRKKPYTVIGIRRLPCFRCGARAEYQWQVCADGRLFRPLCPACDIEMNRMVLTWMGDREVGAKMARYVAGKGG